MFGFAEEERSASVGGTAEGADADRNLDPHPPVLLCDRSIQTVFWRDARTGGFVHGARGYNGR